ncbi:HAMP domain-containing histidine kinase [Actinocrinis puniceicyclus]|uniref:Signal transduction histidine-protein kinase/phosphatase MprB n=1 Tax=Actinocrinis puniceicyclus TaxID=977794 RepID=A0A8J8BFB5_9ACTN|nr:HAMP domain-containing sensor histidine kinase [Actinocrinis puniceicyclus]MBS2966006.1 HAMP domain-containing histidine kinase [Actinocrinis puniceicyclus]
MPLRARVSALVMITVGLAITITSIVSYIIVRNEIVSRFDDDLFQRAVFVAHSELADPTVLPNSSEAAVLLNSLGLEETIVTAAGVKIEPATVAVPLGNGQTVSVHPAAPVGPQEYAVAAGQLSRCTRTVQESTGTYRVMSVQINANEGIALVLAAPFGPTEATLHTLGLVSLLVGLAGVAVAGTAGFLLGRAALRPVQRLTLATEYIAKTGDLRRIEVTGDDELARLTTSFNTMLTALARSQEYQRRLVADAGHELRTPLTSMRTNLDLLAQAMAEPDNPRLSAQDRIDLMNDARAQMEELSLLISDLVELSRDEHPARTLEHVDFADVVERAVERVHRRAPSLTYDVQLDQWYLEGDPAALERAVTNLLDNAAKWSPSAGTVTVRLHQGALQVSDQGPGIAPEDLAHIFERFYRSPEARTMPGSGLGLAIVRQVVENHGGRVAAARAPGGGALLGVWLPGQASDPASHSPASAALSAPGAQTRSGGEPGASPEGL